MSEESRPLNRGEMTEKLLDHLWTMIGYWSGLPDRPTHDRLEGLAHSLRTFLDGSTLNAPAIDLVPAPHPEDKAFHQEEGTNWWPDDGTSVGGESMLHELFYKHGRDKGYIK